MNPFDLSGPSFLVFDICVSLIVIIALKLAIDEAERGAPRALPLSDPYQIAWLRGGTPEAARIAVLSLIDRGLLAVTGDNLVNLSTAQSVAREPIERAILARCAQSGTPATVILGEPAVERACASYRARLERLQLMPDAAMRAQRYRRFAIAAAILLGVALGKIGLGWRPELAAGILAHLDRIDLIEVIADDYFDAAGHDLRALRTFAAQVGMVLHGVSLGLASTAPVASRRLDRIARLIQATGAEGWSEHLAFVRAV